MFIFAPFFKLKPTQCFMIFMSLAVMIPVSLLLLILVSFLIQSLNSTPADVSWTTLFGPHIATWITPWFANTQFEFGITLAFQKSNLSILVAGLALLYGVLSFYNDRLLRDYGERIAKNLRIRVFTKYLSLSFVSTMRVNAGLLSSMVGTDAREAQQTFVRLISSMLKDGLTAILFIVWLILLDYQLFILFITILIPTALILSKTGKVLKKLSKQGLQLESELLNGILERMRGWQTIQMYKAVPFEMAHFNQTNQKIFNTWRRATRAKALSNPLIEWVGVIAASLIAVIALRRIFSEELSSAILVNFVLTVGMLADKITRMADQLNSAKKGTESVRRILDFLKSDLEPREVVNLNVALEEKNTARTSLAEHSKLSTVPIHSVEISNLSVANNESTILIENLSGIFESGSFVVVLGPSGVGKSTFLNALLGIQKQPNGDIYFNKTKANEEIYLQYSSQIGIIPQDPQLFQGSVFDNIVYPQKIIYDVNKTEHTERAQTALELANLNLNLNSNVFGLSGGEKQRLMFARLFFNAPKFVIIDEGTSALDIANETKILQNVKSTLSHAIIFMVSHRVTVKPFATHLIDFSKYKNYA